jgi:P4 family phage/plasmid primase-like protien
MSIVIKATSELKEFENEKKDNVNMTYAKNYKNNGFIPFTLNLGVDNKGKKKPFNVPKFSNITATNCLDYVDNNHNCMALRMGEKHNTDNYYVVLFDVDTSEEEDVLSGLVKWKELVKTKPEINTPTQRTGNNGLHLLFKITNQNLFDKLPTSITKMTIDGKKYSIDFKGKNQLVFVTPTKYNGKSYKWITNFTEELQEMPKWIIDILMNQKETNNKMKKMTKIVKKESFNKKDNASDNESSEDDNKPINVSDSEANNTKKNNIKNINAKCKNNSIVVKKGNTSKNKKKNDDTDSSSVYDNKLTKNNKRDTYETNIIYTSADIQILLGLLSMKRCDDYDPWLRVGYCLYNIDKTYLPLWIQWSKKSKKFEKGVCEKIWKTIKDDRDDKDKLKIGSLLEWCEADNKEAYDSFKKEKETNAIINSKFPNIALDLGETRIINKNVSYTMLNNDNCLIYGDKHEDKQGEHTMYVEMIKDLMAIRCTHRECFGKVYPCEHIQLTQNETNIIFNGKFNVTINNYGDSDDLIEIQKFEIFNDSTIDELVYNSLTGEDAAMADILYFFFKNDYNFGEDTNWYAFKKHKWSLIGQKNDWLSFSGQQKIKELYTKLLDYCVNNDMDKVKIKKIQKIKRSVGSAKKMIDVMTETRIRFLNKNNPNGDFVSKLDTNNYLVGFENGIFDLKNNEFRDGKPDDMITMSVGYDYIGKHTNKYTELLKFINDVLPVKEDKEYFLTYLSHGLFGNTLELFTIITGSGRNGKSKFIELLKVTFGDYYGSVKSQMFTRPRPDANQPDPELLNLKHKKIVISSEPEKHQKLNSGFIKWITGRDSTQIRGCHQNKMIDFQPKFITLFFCNDIPDTDEIDTAFSKRLRCINFPTEFCDNPINNNQKKIDPNIDNNFDIWKTDFVLLLLEYYKKYSNNKLLPITENMLALTNQYKENTDTYITFLNECTNPAELHIRTSTLYNAFKKWYSNNYPNMKCPSNKEFITNIKRHKVIEKIRDGTSVPNGIKNLQLKNMYLFDDEKINKNVKEENEDNDDDDEK